MNTLDQPLKILVTGGAGFIGSNLARRLESFGHAVTVLDDFSSADFRNLIAFNGEVLPANCESEPTGGPYDVIFHEASITDTTVLDQSRMLRNNLEGFRHVLAWSGRWKARVVWASSASIYGNSKALNKESDAPKPLNIYAYSKLAMEQLAMRWAHEHRQIIVGLRYFNVYGPGEQHKGKFASMIYQLAQQMRAGKRPRVFKHGEQMRDFVSVEDVITANLLAMKAAASGIFNVGSGMPASFNQVIAGLNRVLKTRLEPDYIDNPYNFTQDHTEADLSKAKAMLGYEPKYTLDAGINHYHESGAL